MRAALRARRFAPGSFSSGFLQAKGALRASEALTTNYPPGFLSGQKLLRHILAGPGKRPTFGRLVLQYVHLECCDVPLEIGRVCTYKLTLKSTPPQFSKLHLLTGWRATVLRRRVHCLRQALQARREKRIAAGLVPASPSRCRGQSVTQFGRPSEKKVPRTRVTHSADNPSKRYPRPV